ncbi:ATP-binding protein [Paraliomyxa miuraensis]|uniref:ATP-binding protein n=1 Tax=Paraliomyxa miuraensis TaxID=376150 RepID=UPI002250D046|nr:ATP-binding protein [Paraliomyxa miuraensis]MCX4243913.1 PAS domain-containing protein [Paraliomyxa miuraensis]
MSSPPRLPPGLPDVATLHAILAQAPAFITFTDMDLRILYSNTIAEGYRWEDVIGTSYLSFLQPQQKDKFLSASTRVLETGQSQHIESYVEHLTGGRDWYSNHLSALNDVDGKRRGLISISLTITAQKTAELQLERARQELMEASHRSGMAEVITGVLHNVSNVLNSVGVSVSSLSRAFASSRVPVLPRLAKLLQDNGERIGAFMTEDPRGQKFPALLSQLTEELMSERERMGSDLSRLAEHFELMRATVDAQQSVAKPGDRIEDVVPLDLVERTLAMFSIKLVHLDIKVDAKSEVGGTIALDRQSALQILANLILNAIESLEAVEGRPRRLVVRVVEQDDRIAFEVEDNGVGIPQSLIERIFEHGFTTKEDGHGFGLHSSIVAAHTMNGSLSAHTKGPGVGALFRLTLPRGRS